MRDFYEKRKDIIWNVVGLGIFLLGIAVAVFYIWKRCRSEFNADFTDTLLWANASVESGRFYNPEYWYAYFLPFSGIPLMIPIVAKFGVSFFAHKLGMTVFVLIFAAALYFFMRSSKLSYGMSFALSGIVVIFMCASKITRMIFYGHIIHYSLAIVFMCVAYSLLSRSDVFAKDSRSSIIFTFITGFFCMLATTNGVATALLFFVPFAGSIVLERFFDVRPITLEGDRSLIRSVIIIAAGGLLGILIKILFFSSSEYEDSITALLPSDGWMWKQSPFILEWIKVLTDESGADVLMQSFDGIRILVMYMLALVIIILPVFAAISYRKIENRMLRLLILYYWIMFATTMLSYSVSYALVSTWRLAGLACAALIVSLMYTVYMLENKRFVRWFVPVVPFFAIALIVSMLTVRKIPSALNTNPTDQLLQIYEENGLTRGYASSFWNSVNSANVLSDGKVCVAPIFIEPDGSYSVRHYQSEPWEYEDDPGTDRYFVVVDPQDMEYAADTLGKNATDTIKFQDDLYIWVFDRNIFSDLEPVFN